MKIQIEFDLPDEVLTQAASRAAATLFTGPSFGDRSGAAGYAAMESAVRKTILGMDWSAQIMAAVARQAPEIVHDVVGRELRSMVRAQTKAMVADGTLMEGGK
jgi:hypothetical protein